MLLRAKSAVPADELAELIWNGMAPSGAADTLRAHGDLAEAAEFFEQALAICRSIDNPVGVASGLQRLGEVSLHRGDYQQAIGQFRQAIALRREAGDQHGETMALRLAAETGYTHQEASGHRDLAESHHRAGEKEQSRHHREQALTLYTQLGAPEADEVRTRLAAVSPA